MVGRLPDARRAGRLGFARPGDAVAIAGAFHPSLGASELHKLCGEPLPDGLPEADVAAVRSALEAVRDAVRDGALTSCHDVAEGGFLVAVAECCLAGGVGATLDLGPSDEPMVDLFGEGPGGFVVSGPREALEALAARVALDVLGEVGGDALSVTIAGRSLSLPLDELRAAHADLERLFP
jgi:phosphoribosylformylglycinamidine synthase